MNPDPPESQPPVGEISFIKTTVGKHRAASVVVSLLLILLILRIGFGNDGGSSTGSYGASSGSGLVQVKYSVSATSRIGTITYEFNGDTRQDSTEQYRTWISEPFTGTRNEYVYVSAQNASDGTITCEIIVDGTVVKRSSSRGEYAICQTSGRL